MSLIIKEDPVVRIEGNPPDPERVIRDDQLAAAYFELKVFFPEVVPCVGEMTDEEVLIAAANVGTFHFLDLPEEDRYEAEG